MTEQNQKPLVVAIGHEPMDAALTYAAGEAASAGCGLHLVHVLHNLAQGPETVAVAVDLERAGRQVLSTAVERAGDLVPDTVPVTSELIWGGVVTSIVAAAANARMVVLQRRPLSRMMRVVSRSVSSGVAAHSRVPVVSVPARWSPVRSSGFVPTVTVGVDVPDRSGHVIQVAAHAARDRGARLHVLHTWSFPGAYDDIIVSRTEHEEWVAKATAEMQAVLDDISDDVTGLIVEVEARHAFAADALIEAGRTSELMVIGRHDPLVPIGSHLGPVARAVLREANCPVLLADPRPARHWHGRRDRVETAQQA